MQYQMPIIITLVVLIFIYSIYLYARYRRKTSLHAYQEWSDTGGEGLRETELNDSPVHRASDLR